MTCCEPQKIFVTGNTKFDQTYAEVTPEDLANYKTELGLGDDAFPVIVAGSTHAPEEDFLFTAFTELRKQYPKARLVIAPRRTDRVDEIRRLSGRFGYQTGFRSELKNMKESRPKCPVVLIDTIGELGRIYAVGDINGRMQLAHVAKYQGIHVVNHLLGKDDSVDFGIVPSAVFTSPTVAMVGQTEEQLKKDGVAYKAYKSFYRANGKALAEGQSDGMLKVLSDASGKILGVHILGANAADMIHEAATLMNFSATVDDVRRIIHAHPTLSELFSMAVGS